MSAAALAISVFRSVDLSHASDKRNPVEHIDHLTVNSLRVLDSNGKTRCKVDTAVKLLDEEGIVRHELGWHRIGSDRYAPNLSLFDEKGREGIFIHTSDTVLPSGIAVYDDESNVRVAIGVDSNGRPGVQLKGKPLRNWLKELKGESVIRDQLILEVTKKGKPRLKLIENGKTIWQAPGGTDHEGQ